MGWNTVIHRIFMIGMLISLLISIGCSKPAKEAILGKWHKVGGKPKETLEFLKDGSILFGGSSAAAKYEIIDDTHFKIETNGFIRSTLVSEYHLSGKKLSIK